MASSRRDQDLHGTDEFLEILDTSRWVQDILALLGARPGPDLWLGAGTLRDLVWDTKFGNGFDPTKLRDVDIVYFDADTARLDNGERLEAELRGERPDVPWDVKNQAAVHRWYEDRFGVKVPPLRSLDEAVATWPEYATCVAVRLAHDHRLELLAPHGLNDLLNGVWRRNPRRVSVDEYHRRLARKRPTDRWPGVTVVEEPRADVLPAPSTACEHFDDERRHPRTPRRDDR